MSMDTRTPTSFPLFTLFQIMDALFPIGGYTQSYGLETYAQKGLVRDGESVEKYLRSFLINNLLYNDLLSIRFAWEYTCEMRLDRIKELDGLLSALKCPMEGRSASNKLCMRFIKIVEKFGDGHAIIKNYGDMIKAGECAGHYSVIYGMFSHCSGIGKKDAMAAFIYNTASSVINNCAKLIPLSQIEGQVILYHAQEVFETLLDKVGKLTVDDLGTCNIGFDIRAMQHERLYSRLYMS